MLQDPSILDRALPCMPMHGKGLDRRRPDLSVPALARWLALFSCLAHLPVSAQIQKVVNAQDNLNAISDQINSNGESGKHKIIFSQYVNVGTFRFPSNHTSLSDTLFFIGDPDNPGILKLDSVPLLDIQNFKKPVVLEGLSIQLTSPRASLSITASPAYPNDDLILRDCLIYADDLASANFLLWAGGPGSRISIERTMIVARTSLGGVTTSFRLNADTLSISNCNFNLAAIMAGSLVKQWTLKHNTINRMQFNMDGGMEVRADIANNLFAFRGGKNQLPGAANFYPILLSSFYATQPLNLPTNKRFDVWAGLLYPSNSQFTDGSTVIPPTAGKDTTELWNWYLPDTSVGFHSGPAKARPFTVAPGQTMAKVKVNSDSVALWFAPSIFPRRDTLRSRNDASLSGYPKLRYAWPDGRFRNFGNFQIDSLWLEGGTAKHGVPRLLTKMSDTASLIAQTGRIAAGNLRQFVNSMPRAQYFLPAFEGEIPRGKSVVYDKFLPDSLIFDTVDSAGVLTYTTSTSPDEALYLRRDVRWLGLSMGFTTTAILRDSLIYRTNRTRPQTPYLTEKMVWQRAPAIPGNQHNAQIFPSLPLPAGNYAFRALADTVLTAYLVEQLSVPRGLQSSDGQGYTQHTRSASGFQLTVTPGDPPNPDFYDRVSAVLDIRILGRGSQDSVTFILAANGATTAYFDRAGQVSPIASAQALGSDSVRIPLGLAENSGKLFLARKLNIQKNIVFSGMLQGLRVQNFTSPTSGVLAADPLPETNFGADPILQSAQFLKGWVLRGENVSASDFQIQDSLPPSVNKAEVKAYFRAAGSKSWSPAALAFPSDADGKVLVGGLSLTGASLEIIIVQGVTILSRSPKIDTTLTSVGGKIFAFSWETLPSELPVSSTFEVEILTVDVSGRLQVDTTARTLLTGKAIDTLPRNRLGLYRIRVYSGNQVIATWSDNLNNLFDAGQVSKLRTFEDSIWHLLAVPHSTNNSLPDTSWLDRTGAVPKGYRDNLAIAGLETRAGRGDTLAIGKLDGRHGAGEAILVASAKSFQVKWKADQVPPLKALSLGPRDPAKGGWQLLGHPFPFPLLSAQIQSSKASEIFFYSLSSGISASQTWQKVNAILPHQGYAYFFAPNETLTLDPLKGRAAAKASSGPLSAVFTLSWPQGQSQVDLLPGRGPESDIPALPAMGSDVDLRFGSRRGYFRKAMPASGHVDEWVGIYSPKRQKAAWTLSGLPPAMEAVFLDSLSGQVIQSQDDSLTLQPGWNALRLLAAPADELEGRVKAWMQSAISPFRIRGPSLTRSGQPWPVRLYWPADFSSRGGRIDLAVVDYHGRLVFRESWRPQGFGEHLWYPEAMLPTGAYQAIWRVRDFAGSPVVKQKLTVLP